MTATERILLVIVASAITGNLADQMPELARLISDLKSRVCDEAAESGAPGPDLEILQRFDGIILNEQIKQAAALERGE